MKFLCRRFLHGIFLLIGVSILCFVFTDLAPGSFFDEIRLNPQISPETVTALRTQFGLNQPLQTKYVRWVESVLNGEWGYSFAYNCPVSGLLWVRAKNTLLLTGIATLLVWLTAVPLGIWMAGDSRGWIERLGLAGTSVLLAVPELVLALGLLCLIVRTHVLPAGGMLSPEFDQLGAWPKILDLLAHLAVPVATLVLVSLPILLRHVRASMSEVLREPFIQAARGHGISKNRLLFRYALPAAANPLISLFGFSVGGLLSGSLLVEVVTGWPGLGPLLLESTMSRDLYVVIGVVMSSTIFMIFGTFLADMMLLAADPRVRMQ